MANEQNLIPIQKGDLSREEAKRRGSEGGKKSAQSRKRKKLLKDTVEMLISLPMHEGNLDKLTSVDGIKTGKDGEQPTNITVEEAMILKQINKAVKGDLNALKFIVSLYDERQKTDGENDSTKKDETDTDDGFIKALNATAAEVWSDETKQTE